MDILEKTVEAKVENLHEVLGFLEEQLELFLHIIIIIL